jgi:hypothetical protein
MAAVVTCVGRVHALALSSHHSPLSLHFWAGGTCICIWPIDQRKGVRPSPSPSGTNRTQNIPGSPVKKAAVSYMCLPTTVGRHMRRPSMHLQLWYGP